MKTTLKLSFSELRALHYWLMEIMAHSTDLVRQSLHYRIQMEIMGEVLVKKIHPKTLVDTGKLFSIKLSSVEWMAIQAAIYNGWGRFCLDTYVQNVVRNISMNKLPKLTDHKPGYLMAPDDWEEEE
jgi:hypothetical protein